MIRSILISIAMSVGLLAALAPAASADECRDSYNQVITCLEYPEGGFADAFEEPAGPSADAIPDPTPVPEADAAADADAEAAPELAFTGAENSVLTLVGAGLIGAGALALSARRRIEARDDA